MPQDHIPSGEIHVWQATSSAVLANALAQSISFEESKRAQSFRRPCDAQQFVVARGVLRTVLGSYLDRPPRRVQFCYGSAGKPALAGETTLRFNVSHSGSMVLVAVATQREVGVDVERIDPGFDFESLAAHFFSPNEYASLQKTPAEKKRRVFFLTWSRKEALLKAKGAGLAILQSNFQLPVLTDTFPTALRVRDGEQCEWFVADLPCSDNYAAAVATKGDAMQTRLRQWPEMHP